MEDAARSARRPDPGRRSAQIGRITTAGAISHYPVPTPGAAPIRISAGPDGAVWFTEQTGNQIGRVQVRAAAARPRTGRPAAALAPGAAGGALLVAVLGAARRRRSARLA